MKRFKLIGFTVIAAALAATGVIWAFFGVLIAVAALVVITLGVCFVAGEIFFESVISRKGDKSFFLSAPHNAGVLAVLRDLSRDNRYAAWRKQVVLEEISIKSADNLSLCATIVHNRPDVRRWVMVCHGYAYIGNEHMMLIAQTFHELGYWVLMPDARGHGKSGGDAIGMGWPDRLDVLRWIQEIEAREPRADIVLYGVSMGASTVMMASGEDLSPSVKAIVGDCAYTTAMEECAYQFKALFGLPAFPVMYASSLMTRLRAGYWLGEASVRRQLAKSKTPTLMIHGSKDTFVPPSMLEELYAAAACPKQKMLVEGAGHGQSPAVDRERYWETVSGFLARYIAGQAPFEALLYEWKKEYPTR